MAFLKKEKTIQLMFGYYGYSPAIKINNIWQINIISRKIYVMDDITFLTALYRLENCRFCDK